MAGILGCDVDKVYEALEDLLNTLLPKKALHEYGMKESELEVRSCCCCSPTPSSPTSSAC